MAVSSFVRFVAGCLTLGIAFVALHTADLTAESTGAPRYRVRLLPTLGPASLWSVPHDINDRGVVVGMAHSPGDDRNRWWAVRWVDGAIEQLPPIEGADVCWAHGINNRGDIVGACRTAGRSRVLGVLWQPGKAPTVLDSFPGLDTFASNVNNRGIVAGRQQAGIGSPNRPMTWERSLPVLLAHFSDGDEVPFDINDAGHAVGFGIGRDQIRRVILWVDGVPRVVAQHGSAVAINNRGDIVGAGRVPLAPGQANSTFDVPAIWRGGVGRALTPIRGEARGINDRGWAVGQRGTWASHAFVFDGRATHDLFELVDGANPFQVFNEGHAINNAGAIVGHGEVGAQTRGFLLEPIGRR